MKIRSKLSPTPTIHRVGIIGLRAEELGVLAHNSECDPVHAHRLFLETQVDNADEQHFLARVTGDQRRDGLILQVSTARRRNQIAGIGVGAAAVRRQRVRIDPSVNGPVIRLVIAPVVFLNVGIAPALTAPTPRSGSSGIHGRRPRRRRRCCTHSSGLPAGRTKITPVMPHRHVLHVFEVAVVHGRSRHHAADSSR